MVDSPGTVSVRPDQLYRIPDGMTLEEGALSEPFAAIVQAVCEIARVRHGETALVSGPGPMGLLCLKLLVAEGVTTIVAGTGADRERLEAARRFGAAVVVDVEAESLADAVHDVTNGIGVDVTFDCAGHPGSIRGCLDALRPMGRHTQVAICGQDISFPMDRVFYKQLTISGSICYTARTWARMFDIFAEGRLRLQSGVPHAADHRLAHGVRPVSRAKGAEGAAVSGGIGYVALKCRMPDAGCRMPDAGCGCRHLSRSLPSEGWAHQDSNLEPTDYEPVALTIELWPSKRMQDAGCRMPYVGCRDAAA